jgi:hypothetical protein
MIDAGSMARLLVGSIVLSYDPWRLATCIRGNIGPKVHSLLFARGEFVYIDR